MAVTLADYIQKQQHHLGLEDRQAAERADVDLDVYLRYKHGEMKKVHTTTLAKIAAGLDIDASELLRVAGVRRRRIKSEEIKSPRPLYTVSSGLPEPSTPADFAAIMLQRADQLEAEAQEKEKGAQTLLREAHSFRVTAQELRDKALLLSTAK